MKNRRRAATFLSAWALAAAFSMLRAEVGAINPAGFVQPGPIPVMVAFNLRTFMGTPAGLKLAERFPEMGAIARLSPQEELSLTGLGAMKPYFPKGVNIFYADLKSAVESNDAQELAWVAEQLEAAHRQAAPLAAAYARDRAARIAKAFDEGKLSAADLDLESRRFDAMGLDFYGADAPVRKVREMAENAQNGATVHVAQAIKAQLLDGVRAVESLSEGIPVPGAEMGHASGLTKAESLVSVDAVAADKIPAAEPTSGTPASGNSFRRVKIFGGLAVAIAGVVIMGMGVVSHSGMNPPALIAVALGLIIAAGGFSASSSRSESAPAESTTKTEASNTFPKTQAGATALAGGLFTTLMWGMAAARVIWPLEPANVPDGGVIVMAVLGLIGFIVMMTGLVSMRRR